MNNPSPSSHLQSTDQFSYENWRERFLTAVLQGSCILGGIAIILYLISPATTLLFRVLAVLTWGVLVLVTRFTRLPYRVRAGTFLLLLYFAALSSLLDHGMADASILFLGFIAMTGLLFSSRNVIYSVIGITLLSLSLGLPGSPFAEWARVTAILMVVAAIVVIGLHTFQQEFTKTQEAARQMLGTLRDERSTLEQRVEERTAGLIKKTEQLRATSYIARKTAEVQDLATLLNTVAKLVTDQFGFYHTGIFLINEVGDQAVLQAASSAGGQRMIERGHALAVGAQGIVGYVAAQRKPRIALDVGTDAIFFNNPELPMTRSELALPLLSRNNILGVLDIQSDKPQAFNVDDTDVLQTLSDQIAIAIENARLLDETQAAMIQLEALTSIRTREAWSLKLREKNRVFTYTPLGLRAEKLPQQ